MRTLEQIRAELDRAIAVRAGLWESLSSGPDAELSAEAARLTQRIDDLWAEARATEARRRFGPVELIQARARAEERLERESRRERKAKAA